MTAATEGHYSPNIPGLELISLTTTGTTSTFKSKKFNEIIGVKGQNTSDDDGIGIGVSGQTITITVGTSGDVVELIIAGRR